MTDAERKLYGIGAGPVAAICAGALQSEIFSLMRKSYEYGVKMSYAEARESVAQFGIATVNANDYTKKGRPISWTALQSAERDLLRKLVPIGSRPPVYRDWSPKMVIGSNGGERPRLTLEEVNDELFGPDLHPRRERTIIIEAAEETKVDESEYEDEDQYESEVTTIQDFVEYALDRPGPTNVDFKEDRLLAWANFVTGDDYQHDFRWSLLQVLEDYCNAVADSNFKHTKEAAEAARTKYRRIVADIDAGVLEDE
jgi:hypothetical protein